METCDEACVTGSHVTNSDFAAEMSNTEASCSLTVPTCENMCTPDRSTSYTGLERTPTRNIPAPQNTKSKDIQVTVSQL